MREAARASPAHKIWWRRLTGPLHAWHRLARANWQKRTPREQALLRVAGLLLVIVIPWMTIIQPAWSRLQNARQQLMILSVDAAELQALILEAQDLRQQTPGRMSIEERIQALDDSLARSGLSTQIQRIRPEPTDLEPPGWTLNIDQAPTRTLLAWLAETPGLLGLRIETLTLMRSRAQGRELPDRLDGTMQLAVSKEPGS